MNERTPEAVESLLQRIYGYETVPPGQKARDITALCAYQRHMNMSDLQTDEGDCAWCNKTPLPTARHKYCDPDCSDSAYRFCYPQSPANKAYVLMKQEWACRECGLCYEDEVMGVLKTYWYKKEDPAISSLFYWIGYKISQSMDMDHIIPIFKGGIGLGHRNHQVICHTCHHGKTARER